jgi:hypothetical protein
LLLKTLPTPEINRKKKTHTGSLFQQLGIHSSSIYLGIHSFHPPIHPTNTEQCHDALIPPTGAFKTILIRVIKNAEQFLYALESL